MSNESCILSDQAIQGDGPASATGKRVQKLTGSIVTYRNDSAILARAIQSFVNSRVAGHLLVVDNSPSQELRRTVVAHGAEYLFNGDNLGFGKAHNIAIRRFLDQACYHLVLNPDVSFGPKVLDELFVFMEANPGVGLVMPKVLYPDGRIQHLCKRLPTFVDLFERRFLPRPLKKLTRGRMRRFECRDLDLEQTFSIPFLSGCFMLMRTEALRSVGLFDENIFMYLEDADLSRRIHTRFETVYYPYVCITHELGRGSYSNVMLLGHHIKAAIYYFSKWGWFLDHEAERINRAVGNQTPGRFKRSVWNRESCVTEAHHPVSPGQ